LVKQAEKKKNKHNYVVIFESETPFLCLGPYFFVFFGFPFEMIGRV